MFKEQKEFTRANEVIAIHVERYNSQINRLLTVTDYLKELSGSVDRREFYRAKERKLKAYTDCINTLYQKERILQFHNTGFQVEIIEEKIEIHQSINPYDITHLSFEEQLELYQLI